MVSYSTIFVYFLVIIVVALYGYRITKTQADYILAGRNLSGPLAAMGVGASDMSGWLMLGLPGAVYLFGINQIWLPIGLLIGAYLSWIFVAKRLRVYTSVAKDALTIPAYFQNRFAERTPYLRVITAVIVLVFFTFYSAAGFVGGAKTFSIMFEVDYMPALWISGSIVVLYTFIGGFWVVSWLDLFQGFLMLFSLILAPILAISFLGDLTDITATISQQSATYFNVFQGLGFIGVVSLLAWGLGYFGQPHILVRFMAAKTPQNIINAKKIHMVWMFLSLLGAIAVGLLGIAFFADNPLDNAETVFLSLAAALFNPIVAAIVLSAVLSAVMSTIAAQLLASSSALAEDFYHMLIRPKAGQTELVWVARLTVLIVAVVAFLLALDPDSSVLNIVSYAWAGLGASFGPVIILSLHWKRMTAIGAILGMVFGAVTVIVWAKLGDTYGGIFDELYNIVPGFIAGLVGIVIGTLISKPPTEEVVMQHQAYLQALK